MATVTISREYAGGGDEIARRLRALLDCDLFDKRLMASIAPELLPAVEEI